MNASLRSLPRIRRARRLLLVAVLLASAAPARPATLHVPGDHRSIQAAIDAARPGDVVLVAPGRYQESLKLRERITLRSSGADSPGKVGLKRAEAAILDGGGARARGPAVVMAEGATLDGFTITQVGAFDQKEYDRHHATRGEDLPDERGAVGTGMSFAALEVPGVTAVVRNNIVCDNGHAGIGCTGAEGKRATALVSGNVVFRNMGGGIGVANGATPLVQGNRCHHNLRAGIGCRNARPLIRNNECFENVRAGIGVREGARPTIRGNRCYRNRRAGIGNRMKGTSPSIEDNDCFENGMAGIGSRDGATPLISGNRCYDNALAGIGTSSGARAVIVNNRCYRNREAGIGTEEGAHASISHNECFENERAGIGQRGDAETVLCDNHVHHNKAAGIGFEACKAGASSVLRNRVIDNALVAIGVHAGWKVRIAGNELSRKDGLPPIVMVFEGAEASFSDNTIRGSGVAGIRAGGVVRVSRCRFECPSPRQAGPPQFAVWGLPGADILLADSTVRGWRHALSADRAGVTASNNTVSGYWQVGIRVADAPAPPVLLDNTFTSEMGHPGVSVTGTQGIVEGNRVGSGK